MASFKHWGNSRKDSKWGIYMYIYISQEKKDHERSVFRVSCNLSECGGQLGCRDMTLPWAPFWDPPLLQELWRSKQIPPPKEAICETIFMRNQQNLCDPHNETYQGVTTHLCSDHVTGYHNCCVRDPRDVTHDLVWQSRGQTLQKHLEQGVLG